MFNRKRVLYQVKGAERARLEAYMVLEAQLPEVKNSLLKTIMEREGIAVSDAVVFDYSKLAFVESKVS